MISGSGLIKAARFGNRLLVVLLEVLDDSLTRRQKMRVSVIASLQEACFSAFCKGEVVDCKLMYAVIYQ